MPLWHISNDSRAPAVELSHPPELLDRDLVCRHTSQVKDETNDPIEKPFCVKFFRNVVLFIKFCQLVGEGGEGEGSLKGREQVAVSRSEDFTLSVEVF